LLAERLVPSLRKIGRAKEKQTPLERILSLIPKLDNIVKKNMIKNRRNECLEVEARVHIPEENVAGAERLKIYLEEHQEYNIEEVRYTEYRDISKYNRQVTYRQRDYSPTHKELICKSSLAREEIFDQWFSLNVSMEVSMGSMVKNQVKGVQVERYRTRKDDMYIDIVFEFADFPQDNPKQGQRDNPKQGQREKRSRIEVEAVDTAHFIFEHMCDTVSWVCKIIQDSPLTVSRLDWITVKHVTNTQYQDFCINKGRFQKPRTMMYTDLVSKQLKIMSDQWGVTPKIDGIRNFMVIIYDKVYFVDIKLDIRWVGNCEPLPIEKDVIIVDGEYVADHYYVIDLIVYNGQYIGNMKYNNRRELAEDIVHNYKISLKPFGENYRISTKPMEIVKTFTNVQMRYKEWIYKYKMDGLVFVKLDLGYMQVPVKWKKQTTVDLCYIPGTTPRLETRDGRVVSEERQWDEPNKYKHSLAASPFGGPNLGRQTASGGEIWEYFLSGDGKLVPLICRPDKPGANSSKIYDINILHALPGTIFTGEGCYLMRRNHNEIKERVLKNSLNLPPFGGQNTQRVQGNERKSKILLDIGTGQGGDIVKWMKAKVQRVYCIEPEQTAIKEMWRRYNSKKLNYDLIVFEGFLRNAQVEQYEESIDLFTAFFCANAWDDNDWSKLAQIVDKKGAPNCRLLIIALTDPKPGENQCYKLEMVQNEPLSDRQENNLTYKITLKGTRIKELTEKVVTRKTIDRLCNDCNIKLHDEQRLDDANVLQTKEELAISSMYTLYEFFKQ
jgi:hypothetical protein